MDSQNWLEENGIGYNVIGKDIIKIDSTNYLLVRDKEKIISDDFNIILDEDEFENIDKVQRLIFKFGHKYYWTEVEGKTQFNSLKYLGESIEQYNFPFLGIHGKFELLNGSRNYDDWCKKAKFLGIKTLGIIEKSTLAGVLDFQESCIKNEIKPIIGQTVHVKNNDYYYDIIVYVKNKEGWRNLLKINKEQLVVNYEKKFIEENKLVEYANGLILVIKNTTELPEWRVKKFTENFDDVYYQFAFTSWKSADREQQWLDGLKIYLKNYRGVLKPLLVADAYYLDKDESNLKTHLNNIGKINDYQSNDQYFKYLNNFKQDFLLFDNKELLEEVFEESLNNVYEIEKLCDYKIPTKNRYLPVYKMTEWEKKNFSDNTQLFWYRLNEGLEKKINVKNLTEEQMDVYLKRIDEESDVLIEGNVVDYFLILSDICKWCKENDILVGHGRGSAGGALVSYLLDIIEIDPIEYDLLFSRFLTKARLKGSLPDIDVDFSDRDAVIEYMKQRYGKNYVASVATYGNLKVKNAIKDFSRIYGIEAQKANYITGFIKKDNEAIHFDGLIEFCVQEQRFKSFFKKNPEVFEYFDLVLHQTRTASIHACATVIVPDVDEDGEKVDIFDLLPVKLVDGQLVTEWEGGFIEKAGFLKEDILGLAQLVKFNETLKLIKKNYGQEIDIFKIPLDEKEVLDRFSEGFTEDVFQFTSDGLKGYCKYLKPDNLEEIIAANALYRPGAMESDAHTDFVKIKLGEKEPEYDLHLKDITLNTFGLYIYQEQIMKAYSTITDGTMEDADHFRKYITKAYKLRAKGIVDKDFEKYENVFIGKYVEKGQTEQKAKEIWEKLLAFASYGFNRSHAAAYAIISYISQWFKVNYPLEFWTVSLNTSNDDNRPRRLQEITKNENIFISSIDVNKSDIGFVGDYKTNTIYWSLSSVKQLGEKTVENITKTREKGLYIDIEDFYNKVPSKVNKRQIVNIILSGGFDNLQKIKVVTDRFFILKKFFEISEEQHKIKEYEPYLEDKTFWELKQNELIGFGGISFKELCEQLGFKNYIDDLQEAKLDSYYSIAGIVETVIIRKTKNGDEFAILELQSNNIINKVLLWNDCYEPEKNNIKNCAKKLLTLNGVVKYDTFNNKNCLYSNSKTQIKIV